MLPKVHCGACCRRTPSLLLLILSVLLAGCRSDAPEADTPPPERPEPVARRFGDPYEIVLGASPAAPDAPPGLRGDSLVAQVRYIGGCEDHDFVLRHTVQGDTARLWLRHDAHGDDCTDAVFDEVQLALPRPVQEAPVIVLLSPQGGAPYMLRWGDE